MSGRAIYNEHLAGAPDVLLPFTYINKALFTRPEIVRILI